VVYDKQWLVDKVDRLETKIVALSEQLDSRARHIKRLEQSIETVKRRWYEDGQTQTAIIKRLRALVSDDDFKRACQEFQTPRDLNS
jgi:predicted RNase H-like nuclease (RuvC/YqgF family)